MANQISGEFHRGTFRVERVTDEWDFNRRFGTIADAVKFATSQPSNEHDYIVRRGTVPVKLLYRGTWYTVKND